MKAAGKKVGDSVLMRKPDVELRILLNTTGCSVRPRIMLKAVRGSAPPAVWCYGCRLSDRGLPPAADPASEPENLAKDDDR